MWQRKSGLDDGTNMLARSSVNGGLRFCEGMFGLIFPDSSYTVPVCGNAGGKLAFHPHLNGDNNTRRPSAKADNVPELPANAARCDLTSSRKHRVIRTIFYSPGHPMGGGIFLISSHQDKTNQPMSSTNYVRANNGLSVDPRRLI